MRRVLVAIAGLILFALVAADIYMRLQPPRPAPTPAPSPSPSAAPEPTATPGDVGAPTPTPVAASEIIEPTPVAVAEVQPPGATPATRPRPRATRRPPARPRPSPTARVKVEDRAVAAARRTFVSGETTFGNSADEGAGPASDVPRGFEPGGVAAKAGPKVPASIEFEVSPQTPLQPGDPYTVKIFVRNQGKKTIKIRELRVGSTLNGSRSEAAITPRLKDIPPELSALVAEIPSVWKPDVSTWSLEVALRSAHGDLYKNAISWR